MNLLGLEIDAQNSECRTSKHLFFSEAKAQDLLGFFVFARRNGWVEKLAL